MHHPTSMFVTAAFFFAPLALAQEPAAATKPAAALQAPAPAAAAKKTPVFDEAADARAAVTAAVRAALRENRRVLIEWGANWCGWCNLLADKFKSDGDLRKKLLYEYDVVKVDVGHFDKNLDLAKELGAEFKAIP